MVKYI